MFICQICNKEFKTKDALNAHQRVHKSNHIQRSIRDGQILRERNHLKREKRIDEYNKSPKLCKQCNQILEYDESGKDFCNSSCAAKYNNSKRIFDPSEDTRTKQTKCLKCGKDIEVSIRCSKNKTFCEVCRKINISERYHNNLNKCMVCGEEFYGLQHQKTCSDICKRYIHSQNRMQKILKDGTNNWCTKREAFTYKHIKNINCDSKLEKAAIIYLIDVFNADTVERYNNILNYWENDVHRLYNPDFYVKKNNEIYIVEVKMKWSGKSHHNYNRTIPLKKEVLQKYCDSKKFIMMWLDFDYDKEFRKIYYNFNKLSSAGNGNPGDC